MKTVTVLCLVLALFYGLLAVLHPETAWRSLVPAGAFLVAAVCARRRRVR